MRKGEEKAVNICRSASLDQQNEFMFPIVPLTCQSSLIAADTLY